MSGEKEEEKRISKKTIAIALIVVAVSLVLIHQFFISTSPTTGGPHPPTDSCRSAADRCNTRRAANPEDACRLCENQCVGPEGGPIFPEDPEPGELTAIDCCKLGMEDEIHRQDAQECVSELEARFDYQTEGTTVYFDGESSGFDPYHPDREIIHYEWDLDDENETTKEGEDLEEVEFTYNEHGTYDVELKITDDRGKTSSMIQEVYIEG